jgi:zinc transport system substrate-binding protein
VLLGLAGAACRPGPQAQPPAGQPATSPASQTAHVQAVVSILPQADFVAHVGGGHVGVTVLVGPGQSPHTYEPTPEQIHALGRARVFFRIGMPFEETLVPKIRGSFPQLEIVDTRQGVKLRRVEAHLHEPEGGGHDHGEEAGGDDPHIWLDPKRVQIQAGTIADALARVDPAHAADYRRNLAAFSTALDALDARIAAALAPVRGQSFFVYHPAFGYFADAYGLRQVPVELGGKEPAARDVAALVERARRERVRVIFVQPQFSQRSAEVLAREIGGAVVPLDDLPRDYLASLEAMALQIRQALLPPAGP